MKSVQVYVAFIGGAAIVCPHWDSTIERIGALPAQKVVLTEPFNLRRRRNDRQLHRMGSSVHEAMRPTKYDFDCVYRRIRSWKAYRTWQFHNK